MKLCTVMANCITSITKQLKFLNSSNLFSNKFKKQEQNLIDIPPPAYVSHANTKIEVKGDIFEMY